MNEEELTWAELHGYFIGFNEIDDVWPEEEI